MITVTKKFEFDAAHRILGHEGKCKHLHGHHYVAEVAVRGQGDNLNKLDMVMDFADFKKVKNWIDDHWDHNIILAYNDPLAILFNNMGDKRIGLAENETDRVMGYIEPIFQGKAPFIMGAADKPQQPTAEMMCLHLGGVACGLLNVPSRIAVIKVRIYETPTCWAEYVPQKEMFYFSGQVEQQSLAGKFKSGISIGDEEDETIKGDTQG